MLKGELSKPKSLQADMTKGGGSTVEITPVLTEGVLIATYSIDGIEGELYAPMGGSNSNIVKANFKNRITSNSTIIGGENI